MNLFHHIDVSRDKEFQTLFNGFYRVRHPDLKFYDAYYSFMEKNKNTPPSFTKTINHLYEFGRLEASFSSKLLATINPMLPVWDKYILQYFGLEHESPSPNINKEARVIQANAVYNKINQKYNDFLSIDESRVWIRLFDKYYPEAKDKLTPVKKIDLILWRKRN